MSPALNESSAIRRFKHSNAIKICNGITFNFYTGLPRDSISVDKMGDKVGLSGYIYYVVSLGW